MATQLFTNNAKATLSGTLSVGGGTLSVAAGKGNLFPSPAAGDYFLLTIYEKDNSSNEISYEVVKCTSRVADTFDITRDFEGIVGTAGGLAYPSAIAVNPSQVVYIELRHTAYAAGNNLTRDDNLASLGSASAAKTNLGLGNVDNTSNATERAAAATLTNKTIVAASNTITTASSGNLTSTNLNAALAELQTDVDTRATSTALTTHTGQATGAHAATAISTVASGNLAATNVGAALNELQTDVDTRILTSAKDATGGVVGLTLFKINFKNALNTVTSFFTNANTAARTYTFPDYDGTVATQAGVETLTNKTIVAASNTITTAASGNLTSTNLNAALAELQTEIDTRATSTALSTHTGQATGAHAATAISTVASGNLAATNVGAALNELQADIDTRIVSSDKDATGGVVGLTLFKINFKNALNTITSFFTNANTAARTYTFPDKDGTVAMTSDITGVNSGTNTGDNATNTLYSGLVTNQTHTGDATGSVALVVSRINGVALAGLATGILKNTTSTGVPSIAVAGTDYVTPAGTETLTNKTIVAASNTITTAASGNLTSTNLNAALAELQTEIDTRATATALTAHTGAVSGAHAATAISYAGSTNLVATNVEAALDELDAEKIAVSSIGITVQAYDAQLADVAGLTPTNDGVIIGNGTSFVVESGATLKTSLGLTIGTNVQAWDADLDTWATKTAPTGVVVGTTDTQTITNKRVTSRIGTVTSASTITPTSDSSDQYNVTALAVASTIAAPSGTPTDGQKLMIRIKDNGTARALTWTATSGAYRAIGATLPTTTVVGKTTYAGCIYNSADSIWDVVAVATQE